MTTIETVAGFLVVITYFFPVHKRPSLALTGVALLLLLALGILTLNQMSLVEMAARAGIALFVEAIFIYRVVTASRPTELIDFSGFTPSLYSSEPDKMKLALLAWACVGISLLFFLVAAAFMAIQQA